MSKLDAKVFSSITPFAKQWILGEELMYEFLAEYPVFLSDSYGIVDLGSLTWVYGNNRWTTDSPSDMKVVGPDEQPDWYCDTFVPAKASIDLNNHPEAICYVQATGNKLYTYAESATAAKPAGYLVYRLAD